MKFTTDETKQYIVQTYKNIWQNYRLTSQGKDKHKIQNCNDFRRVGRQGLAVNSQD